MWRFEINNELIKNIKWQFIQALALLMFVLQIRYFENKIIFLIAQDSDIAVRELVSNFLSSWQWFFLPDEIWISVLPLACITIGMILFSKWRWWFLSVVAFVMVGVLVSNRIYFSFFDSVISVSSLEIADQLWKVKSSVIASLEFRDFIWFLSLCWLPLFSLFIYKKRWESFKKNKIMFVSDKILGIVLLALTIHSASVAFLIQNRQVSFDQKRSAGADTEKSKENENLFVFPYNSSYRCFAVSFGVFNFYINNSLEYISETFYSEEVTEEKLTQVSQYLTYRQEINLHDAPLKGIGQNRNVILISLESFSTWLIDLEIDGQEITPTLNQLSKNHLFWPKTIDGARTGGTSDAEFSLLTGLLTDLRRIAAMGIAERNDLLSLPRSLKDIGYTNYSFHGNSSSFWNRNITHPKLGIDNMLFEEEFSKEESVGLGVSDKIVFRKAAEVLANSPKPFFGFIISLSSHHPYPTSPNIDNRLDLRSVPRGQLRRYLELANYTDRVLGDFISDLEKSKVLNNSVIVMYGDHKPPMLEKEYREFEKIVGFKLLEGRILQIPLIIALPGLESEIAKERSAVLETVGGLQDVFPTVLHLLGEDIPFGIYGINLMIPNEQRGVFPLLKLSGGYVKNGVVYLGENGEIFKDKLGYLFADSKDEIMNDPFERKLYFGEAFKALEVHLSLFSQNTQKRLIERKRSEVNFEKETLKPK